MHFKLIGRIPYDMPRTFSRRNEAIHAAYKAARDLQHVISVLQVFDNEPRTPSKLVVAFNHVC